MSKSEFAVLVVAALLVSGFLGMLVMPQLFQHLNVHQAFQRLYEAGNYPEAERFLDSHLKSHPDSIWALLWQAQVYAGKERYEDAYGSILKVIDLQPENLHAWIRKAYISTQLDAPDDVLASVDKYFKLGGNKPQMHAYKGWAYLEQEKYLLAEAEYKAYLLTKPQDSKTLYALAEIAFELKRLDEAREYCERSLALDPGYSEAESLLRKISITSPRR